MVLVQETLMNILNHKHFDNSIASEVKYKHGTEWDNNIFEKDTEMVMEICLYLVLWPNLVLSKELKNAVWGSKFLKIGVFPTTDSLWVAVPPTRF